MILLIHLLKRASYYIIRSTYSSVKDNVRHRRALCTCYSTQNLIWAQHYVTDGFSSRPARWWSIRGNHVNTRGIMSWRVAFSQCDIKYCTAQHTCWIFGCAGLFIFSFRSCNIQNSFLLLDAYQHGARYGDSTHPDHGDHTFMPSFFRQLLLLPSAQRCTSAFSIQNEEHRELSSVWCLPARWRGWTMPFPPSSCIVILLYVWLFEAASVTNSPPDRPTM